MWRFLRIGLKNTLCNENSFQFRIIATSANNNECDDKIDEDNTNEYLVTKVSKIFKRFSGESKLFRCNIEYSPITYKNSHHYYSTDQKSFKYASNSPDGADFLKNITKNIITKDDVHHKLVQDKTQDSAGIQKSEREIYKSYIEKLKISQYENDSFGCLANDTNNIIELIIDEDDQNEHKTQSFKEKFGPKLTTKQYEKKILLLCKEKKLKEALEVLDVEMKVQNVIPDEYCFNILVNACGKVGYRQKAFELNQKMLEIGLKQTKFALTGLFNAIANSPEPAEEKLKHAKKLRQKCVNKHVSLHPITYHAMIKAFGRCEDLESAFEIADEMVAKGHVISSETINFLLQGCLSDKVSGFRHALALWRTFRILNISPCIYSYNLLLRIANECQPGDPVLVQNLIEHLEEEEKFLRHDANSKIYVKDPKGLKKVRPLKLFSKINNKKTKDLPILNLPDPIADGNITNNPANEKSTAKENNETIFNGHSHLSNAESIRKDQDSMAEKYYSGEFSYNSFGSPQTTSNAQSNSTVIKAENVLPDPLGKSINGVNVISVNSLDSSDKRLMALGGIRGVLNNMISDGVAPNVTTFTHLLNALPISRPNDTNDISEYSSKAMEEELLSQMESLNVTPDLIFCNMLIRRRSFCHHNDRSDVLAVLDVMARHRLSPDLITYGCLALSCKTSSDSRRLLSDMRKAGIRPNIEILSALLSNFLHQENLVEVVELMSVISRGGHRLPEALLDKLEATRKKVRSCLIENERKTLFSNRSEVGATKYEENSESTKLVGINKKAWERKQQEIRLFLMEYNKFLRKSKLQIKEHPWTQYGYKMASSETNIVMSNQDSNLSSIKNGNQVKKHVSFKTNPPDETESSFANTHVSSKTLSFNNY